MNLPKMVAKMRLWYHLNAIDMNNVMHQLHIRNGEKADRKNRDHFWNAMDCYERLGIPIAKHLEQMNKEESH